VARQSIRRRKDIELQDILTLLVVPVTVYVVARLLEKSLGALYRKWQGDLTFHEAVSGESGILTIQANSTVFLDDLTLHLPDKPLNLLDSIKDSLGLNRRGRLQFGPNDKIQVECLVQSGGDKQLMVRALIGTATGEFTENLMTQCENPTDFMSTTDVSVETPRRRYSRKLLAYL